MKNSIKLIFATRDITIDIKQFDSVKPYVDELCSLFPGLLAFELKTECKHEHGDGTFLEFLSYKVETGEFISHNELNPMICVMGSYKPVLPNAVNSSEKPKPIARIYKKSKDGLPIIVCRKCNCQNPTWVKYCGNCGVEFQLDDSIGRTFNKSLLDEPIQKGEQLLDSGYLKRCPFCETPAGSVINAFGGLDFFLCTTCKTMRKINVQ